LTWTPTAADIGIHDISIEVTDSGLPPQDAGIPLDPNAQPIPNTRARTLRVVVRIANTVPEILGITVNGESFAATTSPLAIAAAEGVPLGIEIAARDADLDHLHWTVTNLPAGMRMQQHVGSAGSASLTLSWTPGPFAAQDAIGGSPGHYALTIHATDGHGSAEQSLSIDVANTNLAPQIPPIPMQIVREGETMTFGIAGYDADGDPVTLALVKDANTPAGVHFDSNSGTVEWTPDHDTIDNSQGNVP
jgi:hypothetical protein